MVPARKGSAPTRRGVLWIIGGTALAGSARLFAFASDFWNRKDPGEWSSDEISQLTSKSPWAKEVSTSYTPSGARAGAAEGPAAEGRGERRSRDVPGVPGQTYKGIIRWESAKPVMDALRAPLAPVFTNHYVISVTGFQVNAFGGRKANASIEDMLDRLKGITSLKARDQPDVQPGIVQQPPSGNYGTTVLFGFSKEILLLTLEDKEVVFSTEFGRVSLKAKFNLRDMIYRGELAL